MLEMWLEGQIVVVARYHGPGKYYRYDGRISQDGQGVEGRYSCTWLRQALLAREVQSINDAAPDWPGAWKDRRTKRAERIAWGTTSNFPLFHLETWQRLQTPAID